MPSSRFEKNWTSSSETISSSLTAFLLVDNPTGIISDNNNDINPNRTLTISDSLSVELLIPDSTVTIGDTLTLICNVTFNKNLVSDASVVLLYVDPLGNFH